ncbi:MAG: VCBS repeat-containing protein, partial [Acidimicrobiia bacterium]|nr:VCBS repeat-containing protein [Acidimicrobiia bacterium]
DPAGSKLDLAIQIGTRSADLIVVRHMPVRTSGQTVVGALISVAVVLLLAPSASAAEAPAVEEGFEGSAWYQDWTNWYPGPVNQATPGTGIDGAGLTVTIPPGSHYGSRFAYTFSRDDQPETLYFRYFLRFADDFGGEGTGKLPGPVGIYNGTALGGRPSTPERPGWSARMQFAPGPTENTTLLGYYAYHIDQPGVFGEGMSWGPVGVVANGEWNCIEGAVDLNTPGEHDGSLRGWVNEVPALQREGLAFRRVGEDDLDINSFWFNVYFGGKRPATASKQISFDNVALGPDRIGCGGPAQIAIADMDGDGRDDAVELVGCGDATCWSIEPGGPLAFSDPTLVPAEPRTSVDTVLRGLVAGRFTDDAHEDVAYVGRCADGTTCWIVHPSDGTGPGPPREWGASAPVSGARDLLSGDVNGDGLDDLISRGRCDGQDCWLVQYSTGQGFTAPQPAGDGAYFSDSTVDLGIGVADLTGDGLDDLVYRGLCGERRPCWRVQASTGGSFLPGVSWGNATGFAEATTEFGFQTGDVNGDGRHDVLYRGDCNGSECWRALLSRDNVFIARYWGSDAQFGVEHGIGFQAADVDANGKADLIYRAHCPDGMCWTVQLSTGTGFVSIGSEPVVDFDEPRPASLRPGRANRRIPVLS